MPIILKDFVFDKNEIENGKRASKQKKCIELSEMHAFYKN